MTPKHSLTFRFRATLLTLALSIASPWSLAQDPNTTTQASGRYQAVVVPQGGRGAQTGSLNAKVLILDSQAGHLWIWSEGEAIYGAEGRPQFGTVLIYQGKIRPGSRMGEVIDQFVDR